MVPTDTSVLPHIHIRLLVHTAEQSGGAGRNPAPQPIEHTKSTHVTCDTFVIRRLHLEFSTRLHCYASNTTPTYYLCT